MVNKEQIFNGLIKYIDNEVMPHLPTHGKWMIGTSIVLISDRLDAAYNALLQSPYISMLGITSPDGMLDIGKLAGALSATANKYGKLQLNLPGLSSMNFSGEDVEMIRQYITGER